MAVTPVRQGTVSADIQQVAAQLMEPQRAPITALEAQRTTLNNRSTVLSTLKTRLLALRSAADTMGAPGTLSPFAAKAASSSDPTTLSVSASAGATASAFTVAVGQLAHRSTHASDLYTDAGTTISAAGAGTFNFSVTIAGTTYDVSVSIGAGDTDKTVLDAVADALTTAMGGKGSAVRIQTETGKSRLSISSGLTGTANKLTFTDTDGLLARIGVAKASPTAATATTGGYIFEDLGGHELDARLVVDGFTYYRDSNTISDLVPGVTLNLKATSTTDATVSVQSDTDFSLAKLKDFIAKYNDVIDYLKQNTFIDPKAGTRGVLALDPVFNGLASQLRFKLATRVASQPAGKADNLAVLGIVTDGDGKLSIKNEAELQDKLIADPAAAASLFNATDGIATQMETFVDGYSRSTGLIAGSQSQINSRIDGINKRIDQLNDQLARRQTVLELQLAQAQAVLDKLQSQATQMNNILSASAVA